MERLLPEIYLIIWRLRTTCLLQRQRPYRIGPGYFENGGAGRQRRNQSPHKRSQQICSFGSIGVEHAMRIRLHRRRQLADGRGTMGESTPRCGNLQRSLAGKLSIICKTAQSDDDCAVFFIVASAARLTSGETLFAGGQAVFHPFSPMRRCSPEFRSSHYPEIR